jgi:hypothetical protein
MDNIKLHAGIHSYKQNILKIAKKPEQATVYSTQSKTSVSWIQFWNRIIPCDYCVWQVNTGSMDNFLYRSIFQRKPDSSRGTGPKNKPNKISAEASGRQNSHKTANNNWFFRPYTLTFTA